MAKVYDQYGFPVYTGPVYSEADDFRDQGHIPQRADYATSAGWRPQRGYVPKDIARAVRNIAKKFRKRSVIWQGVWYTVDERGWVSRGR